MNIAIIGYGNMGRMIEQVAIERGHTVKCIIDPNEQKATHREINESALNNVDVSMDFSLPTVVLGNLEKLAKLKKNVVIGTTGWHKDIEKAKRIVKMYKIGLIYANNFSLGVNIFYRIVESSAKIFNNIEEYDTYVYELHHRKKLDTPSGTAKTIGDILLKNINRKRKLVFEQLNRKINEDELHVASIRSGSIPGTHIVGFDSESDTIELKHTARNRKGFALGAIMAGEWIKNKRGVYTIDEMLKDILE
ncbi:MAG: 4-hydroxy-tetrahydrodipicolinate reductase [Nanoarchaeota archaeon]